MYTKECLKPMSLWVFAVFLPGGLCGCKQRRSIHSARCAERVILMKQPQSKLHHGVEQHCPLCNSKVVRWSNATRMTLIEMFGIESHLSGTSSPDVMKHISARQVSSLLALSINTAVNQWGTHLSHITSHCVTEDYIKNMAQTALLLQPCDWWCFNTFVYTLRWSQCSYKSCSQMTSWTVLHIGNKLSLKSQTVHQTTVAVPADLHQELFVGVTTIYHSLHSWNHW